MSELNTEQVIENLERSIRLSMDFNCDHPIITYSQLRFALALIKELTSKTQAQDIVISELRHRVEKAEHDAERYSKKIKELAEENKAWQKQLINTEEQTGKAYYDLACEVEDLRAEKEGQWLMCGIFDDLAKCSVCGYQEHSLMEVYDKHFRFCPNCGAKMKGE